MFLGKLGRLALLAAIVAWASHAGTPEVAARAEARRLGGAIVPANSLQPVSRQSISLQSISLQSRNPDTLSVGKVLVASRNLGDPNFAETVILIVQYDAGGVVGLVLNHRTKLPLSRALDGSKAAKDLSDPVYLGGPVDRRVVMALLKSPAQLDGAKPVFDGISLISTKALFDKTIAARPEANAFRVYFGYAGWNREQLQKEMELGAWFVFPADAETVFNSDPGSLWPKMIRKTELNFARNGFSAGDSSDAPPPQAAPMLAATRAVRSGQVF
jgi:putative transcriptional regulator